MDKVRERKRARERERERVVDTLTHTHILTHPEMSYTVIIISTSSIRVDIGGQSKLIKNSVDKS